MMASVPMVWAREAPLLPPFYCFTLSLPLTGKVASESISLEVPEDVVPDSAKAYVTVLGKQPEILSSKRKKWGQQLSRCGVS